MVTFCPASFSTSAIYSIPVLPASPCSARSRRRNWSISAGVHCCTFISRAVSRIANWSGRQTAVLIGIIRRIELQVLTGQAAVIFPQPFHPVNHGRVALQPHTFAETVFKCARYQGTLFRLRCLPLDERGQSHN